MKQKSNDKVSNCETIESSKIVEKMLNVNLSIEKFIEIRKNTLDFLREENSNDSNQNKGEATFYF